ncbi:MAG: hypothetical protein M5U34_21495 [Chloroflexi bacterium]|nr:hypothetical protein [Chloroflexota bacterium]
MVVRETIEEILTDAGPTWIGADGIWDGSGAPAGLNSKGEGVVVAILDTGINSEHPSLPPSVEMGMPIPTPWGAGVYLGVCDPGYPDYQVGFACNDKLIGVHDFVDGVGNDPYSSGRWRWSRAAIPPALWPVMWSQPHYMPPRCHHQHHFWCSASR